MTKLERSIRHELSYIGPGLRAGSYGLVGHFVGVMPSRGLVNALYCDVDTEHGIVSNIRMYGSGDAMERRDYYGESVNITSALDHYFTNHDYEWNDFVQEIAEIVQEHIIAYRAEMG
ncbi:hypothetical protein [Pseudoflavonifractor phocaeensis]|uniref:hypothetical protein n=1 Tax=Pseudoflavonifractor phocaeensis TaxID=1870988 RepID=UPI00195DFD22|nr:hypothetical protein [Pseudoflavonifractor phocaeensis]MBM6725078.1 hypothetical protein [Pseudoflavonifractor phocaeensis]